jgi:predicted DNA-binding transcriptional regulator YafY
MPHRRATDRERQATLELTDAERLVQAILGHRLVTFRYQGLVRTVEPHLVGLHEAGEPLLIAYQSEGPSRSGDLPGWRTFVVTEIEGLNESDRQFAGPRLEFDTAAHRMLVVFARA